MINDAKKKIASAKILDCKLINDVRTPEITIPKTKAIFSVTSKKLK